MYSLICYSNGISSVAIATRVGISQKTDWKMIHSLRAFMAARQNLLLMMAGIVELDEKYLWVQVPFSAWAQAQAWSQGTLKSVFRRPLSVKDQLSSAML